MKWTRLSIFALVSIAFLPLAFASTSEKVRMIKVDHDNKDLVVEKLNGEKWLVQYNRSCTSMNTEFLLEIVTHENDDDELKVASNELCKIYYSFPYDGEGTIVKLIKSKNLIIPDHEAKITWKNKEYDIDYEGKACRSLYQFIDKRVYFSMDKEDSNKGLIVMPNRMGQCAFTFKNREEAKVIETPADKEGQSKVEGLDYQAQVNKVYFYWQPDTTQEKPLYALSYSKYELDPADYTFWREMPKARFIRNNSYTVRRLSNGQDYHFYLAVLDENLEPGEWTHVKVAPVAPVNPYVGQPNETAEKKFQIKLDENEGGFRIYWPEDEFARRYFLSFYVDGKKEFFKIAKSDVTEWVIPKEAQYLGKGLRFTVRSLPKTPFDPRSSDGIYWRYESE